MKHTPETILKIRNAAIKRFTNQDERKKLGKIMSEVTKGTKNAMYGKHHKTESIEKMKKAKAQITRIGNNGFDRRIRAKYKDFSEEKYNKMLTEQNGLCAICNKPEIRKRKNGEMHKLSVDHDHETGIVRGLLCNKCNHGIGLLGKIDVCLSAYKYLLKYKQIK